MNEILKTCHEIVQDPKKYLWEQHQTGKFRYISYSCIFVPEELIHAAGFVPVRLLGFADNLMESGKYLPSCCCEFAKNLMESVLSGSVDFCEEIVFAHCCDTLQVVSDIFTEIKNKPVSILNIPTNFTPEQSISYLNTVIQKFLSDLESRYQIKVTTDKMVNSWNIYNENRLLINALYSLRRQKPGLISGYDSIAVIAAGMFMPKELHNQLLRQLLDELNVMEYTDNHQKKLIISGFINGNIEIVKLIEDNGAVVVDDDLCETSRALPLQWDSEFEFPASLSRAVLSHCCPVKHNISIGYSELVLGKYHQTKANGIILTLFPFCDPQSIELAILRYKLKQEGIKSFVIEVMIGNKNVAQLETRIEAFLESIGERTEC